MMVVEGCFDAHLFCSARRLNGIFFCFSLAKMSACNICFGVSSDCELGVSAVLHARESGFPHLPKLLREGEFVHCGWQVRCLLVVLT